MKKRYTNIILLVFLALITPAKLNAQSVCMVSADYQSGKDYIVFWEAFSDVSNIDSIFIYRKQDVETVFSKIGAVDVTLTSPTFFIDENANTMDTTKYAISYLFTSGTESSLSPWHQAVVMDYYDSFGMGELTWTKYKKEDQIDEYYIYSYECRMDETGLGMFQSMATMMNYYVNWTDQSADSHPIARYELLTSLPDCFVTTKANINTSRSNIKNQQSNAQAEAEAGISGLVGVNYSLAPNPVGNELTVTTTNSIKAKVWISNANGEMMVKDNIDGNTITFDTRMFSSGVYFINIDNNGVITSKKFVKK